MIQPPHGRWFMVACATCGLLVGWTRQRLPRAFYCIPHFDEVAHLPDEGPEFDEVADAR